MAKALKKTGMEELLKTLKESWEVLKYFSWWERYKFYSSGVYYLIGQIIKIIWIHIKLEFYINLVWVRYMMGIKNHRR
jgi:hypothetical protein